MNNSIDLCADAHSLDIAPARKDDIPTIARIHLESARVAYRGIYPNDALDGLTLQDRIGLWQERATTFTPGARAWLASEKGSPFGFCVTRIDPDAAQQDGSAEIFSLYILPSHWRHGYGRCLLRWALDDLRAREFTTIVVWTIVQNIRGRRFYEAAGFLDDDAVRDRERWEAGFKIGFRELRYRRSLHDKRN